MGYSGIGQGQSIGKDIWLYPIIERTLKLSGLKKSDKTLIYTDTNRNRNIFNAFYTAANNLCDSVFAVVDKPGYGPYATKSREPDPRVIKLMSESNFIIDLPTNHWCYTHAYNEVLDSGAKMLLSCSDEELIYRLAPIDEIIQKTEKAADIITGKSKIRIVSDAGTDIEMSIRGRVCNAQVGAVSEKRRWDNFPSGLTEIAPVEDSVNGTLVIAPGDPVVELNKLINEQIRCEIRGGEIINIEGGLEAKHLRDWLNQWEDPAAKVIAHTGFGTDFRATIFSTEAMDWESLEGGINIAFGSNFARFLNGKNVAKSHIDIILMNASFYVDDLLMVDKGKLVF